MKKFGLCMETFEDRFEALIHQIASTRLNPARLRPATCYVEIGIWLGSTLETVAQVLSETSHPWHAWGIDPKTGYEPPDPTHVTILYCTSTEAFKTWTDPIDLCLIDGCHCFECAKQDFLLVEPFMTEGSAILFHDFSPRQQTGKTEHGEFSFGVRDACSELGLFSGRDGWHPLTEEWEGPIAGMGVLRHK